MDFIKKYGFIITSDKLIWHPLKTEPKEWVFTIKDIKIKQLSA